MGDLSHIYRDPLFSVAVLIAIIAFAILSDYYRNFYRKKKKEKSLKALIKSYEHNGFFDGIAEFLKVSRDPVPTLLLLAKGYVRSGDNQQAIKIYLTLLTQIEDSAQKLEILENLGEAYFQAGFLQKSKEIFLEILANNPRSIQTLLQVIRLYETLGEYSSALEALQCLEENLEYPTDEEHQKITLLGDYLGAMILLQDHHKSEEEKALGLLKMLKKQKELTRVILTYFKLHHIELFWEALPMEGWQNHIDLLWDFTLEQIPQKRIANTQAIEVFQAKGYYPSQGCSNFTLETIRLLNLYSSFRVRPSFSYHCGACLGDFPFDSFRCPSCGALGMMKLNIKPQKIQHEKNFSLL